MKKLLKLIGKYKIFLAFSVIFAAISVVLQLYVPVYSVMQLMKLYRHIR